MLGAARQVISSASDFLGTGADAVRGLCHGLQRLRERFCGVVEVCPELVELGRQILGQAGRQVASSNAAQRSRDRRDRLTLALFGFDAGDFRSLAPLVQCLQIGGDCKVHVEHHGLDQGGQHGAGLFGAATARHETRPLLLHDRLDEMLRDHRVAADIPGRLQADLRVHLANLAHGLLIARAIRRISDRTPVRFLTALCRRDLSIGREKLRGVGVVADLLVEHGQCRREVARQRRLQVAQTLARLVIEADEIQTLVERHRFRMRGDHMPCIPDRWVKRPCTV